MIVAFIPASNLFFYVGYADSLFPHLSLFPQILQLYVCLSACLFFCPYFCPSFCLVYLPLLQFFSQNHLCLDDLVEVMWSLSWGFKFHILFYFIFPSFISSPRFTLAERVLYLPSMGFSILLALLFWHIRLLSNASLHLLNFAFSSLIEMLIRTARCIAPVFQALSWFKFSLLYFCSEY